MDVSKLQAATVCNLRAREKGRQIGQALCLIESLKYDGSQYCEPASNPVYCIIQLDQQFVSLSNFKRTWVYSQSTKICNLQLVIISSTHFTPIRVSPLCDLQRWMKPTKGSLIFFLCLCHTNYSEHLTITGDVVTRELVTETLSKAYTVILVLQNYWCSRNRL